MTAQELDQIVELLTSRPAPENPTPEIMRERFGRLAEFLPTPADAQRETVDAGGVPAEMIAAPGVGDAATILYLHGGGYVIGSIDTHRTLAYNLSKAADARVLVIDYRLAPEAPFPAAVDDAVAAYRWLLDQGSRAGQLAVAGDSAGGGLTVATMVAARDQGLALPACGVCISPWVDMEGLGDSMSSQAEADPMVTKEGLLGFAGLYLAGQNARSPLAAPLYAELKDLPPLLIQVGTRETLYDDSTRLAARAEEAGVLTTLEEWSGMIHVWHLFAPMLSEGRDAINKAGDFVQSHIAAA